MRVMPISTQGNVVPVKNNGKQVGKKQIGSDFVKNSDIAFTRCKTFTGCKSKIGLGAIGAALGSAFDSLGTTAGAAAGVWLGHKCDKDDSGDGKLNGYNIRDFDYYEGESLDEFDFRIRDSHFM